MKNASAKGSSSENSWSNRLETSARCAFCLARARAWDRDRVQPVDVLSDSAEKIGDDAQRLTVRGIQPNP